MTWLMLLLGREGRIKDQRVCYALVCAAFHLMHVSSMNFIIAVPIFFERGKVLKDLDYVALVKAVIQVT
jgi:hypothetical protein